MQKSGTNACKGVEPFRSRCRGWPLSAHLARSRGCWRTSLHRTHNSRSLPARDRAPRTAFVDLLPGKPPEGKLDGRGLTKVAKVSARFSTSFARRRFRPNQEKVRSTTQRRGRTTKPLISSLRLTISMRQQRHLCHSSFNLPGPIGPDQFEPGETPADLFEDQSSPVAVLDRGGVDDDPHRA